MCSDGRLVRSELGIFVFYLDLLGMQSIDKELEKILFEKSGIFSGCVMSFCCGTRLDFVGSIPQRLPSNPFRNLVVHP